MFDEIPVLWGEERGTANDLTFVIVHRLEPRFTFAGLYSCDQSTAIANVIYVRAGLAQVPGGPVRSIGTGWRDEEIDFKIGSLKKETEERISREQLLINPDP